MNTLKQPPSLFIRPSLPGSHGWGEVGAFCITMNEEQISECIKSGNYSGVQLLRIIAASLPQDQRDVLFGCANMIDRLSGQLVRALERDQSK